MSTDLPPTWEYRKQGFGGLWGPWVPTLRLNFMFWAEQPHVEVRTVRVAMPSAPMASIGWVRIEEEGRAARDSRFVYSDSLTMPVGEYGATYRQAFAMATTSVVAAVASAVCRHWHDHAAEKPTELDALIGKLEDALASPMDGTPTPIHPPMTPIHQVSEDARNASLEIVARWIDAGGPPMKMESNRLLMADTVRSAMKAATL